MAANFVSIQLIYQEQTHLSQPKHQFLKEFNITQTPNNWANEKGTIGYLQSFLIPHIDSLYIELPAFKELNSNNPWLLILDVLKVGGKILLRKLSNNLIVKWVQF